MKSMNSSISTNSSIRKIFNNVPKLCRFCLTAMLDDEAGIDVFTSKIGNRTIIEIVKNYFAVVQTKSYEQYLNGMQWTSEHLEVTDFELNNEKHDLCCICTACLKVVTDITWFTNSLRYHNLQSLSSSTLCTMVGNCTLINIQGDVVQKNKLIPSWNYEQKQNSDGLSNFWDACIFCFKHNNALLFDIFSTTILDSSVADIIKLISMYCKEECIQERVHMLKSSKKSIRVVDFQWNMAEKKQLARKICLNCLLPIIKIKALIEVIRKTNGAVPFIELINKLDGSVELNIPCDNLEVILQNCVFYTNNYETIPSSEILKIINEKMKSTKSKLVAESRDTLLHVITEISEPDNSSVDIGMELIYCKYCDKDIKGCLSFEAHVLTCMIDNIVDAVDIHNDAMCNHCISIVFKTEETLRKLPIETFKNCSICKLWLYIKRDSVDKYLSFTQFVVKYFQNTNQCD